MGVKQLLNAVGVVGNMSNDKLASEKDNANECAIEYAQKRFDIGTTPAKEVNNVKK